ncbi:MAG: hypothetical protein HPY64_15660 [Anaerolineae bacterium]|nr:hypothetical protein [Anaerolineae bacterium]
MLTLMRDDFHLTKRDLGWIMLVVGLVAVIGLLALDPVADWLHSLGLDVLPPDRQAGFGPMQRLALLVGGVLAVVGLTLIPLGREPVTLLPQEEPSIVREGASPGRITRVLLLITLAVMLFYFGVYVVYAVNLFQFPFDYDQGEGFELVDTILFSQFRWPYQDTEVYPFYSSNYPPLFHVLAAPFVWLFGPAYWYGRLLGFLGTLVTASAIGYAVYRAERQRVIAVIAGLAFLASNTIYHVGPLFRQHLFMVMFETLAVVALANVHALEGRARRRRLIIGLLLLLAAGYTKQLAVVTVAAVFVFLFLANPRHAAGWGLLLALVAGSIFLLIDRATGGQWWLNIITANVNQFVPGQFPGLFRQWFGLHGALLILAGLLAIYELYFDRVSLYTIWFGTAVLSTTSAGKWGAGDSYFATAIAATCILSGIFAARTLRGGWHWPDNYLARLLNPIRVLFARAPLAQAGLRLMMPVSYLLYAAAVFHMPTEGALFGPLARTLGVTPNTDFAYYDSAGWTVGYAVLGQIPTPTDVENGWRLVAISAEGDRPALSEDAAFSWLAGKDVVGNPTQLLNLYNNGLYDPSALVTMIEDQAFNVLILRALFYPDPVLYTMMQAYSPAEVIPMNGFEYRVYHPDPGWPSRRALRDRLLTLDNGSRVEAVISPPRHGAETWLEEVLRHAGFKIDSAWSEGRALFRQAEDGLTARVTLEPQAGEMVRVLVEAAS